MKRVKCYGRKKTALVETSATKAFFEDFSPQVINCNRNINSSRKGSIYSTESDISSISDIYPLSWIPTNINQSSNSRQAVKKKLIKAKTPFKKYKKYKGVRKCKKAFNQPCQDLQASVEIAQPNWSSINAYSFVIDHNFNKISHLSYDSGVKCKVSLSDQQNSEMIDRSIYLRTSLSFPNYKNSFIQKEVILASQREENFDFNHKCSLSSTNKFVSPVCTRKDLNSFPSPVLYKNLLLQKNKGSFSMKHSNLMTSTPIIHYKKRHMNVSNISEIALEKKQKGELTFESISYDPKPCARPSRSLNINMLKTSIHHSSVNKCAQQEFNVFRKSCSNREKSIYLRSHSCLKEVLTDAKRFSALPKLLELCNQSSTIPFMDIYDWSKTTFRKVGEGSYGEVFMLTQNKKSVILKVIPVSEDSGNNLQCIESVYSEIKVSHCLSELRYNSQYRTKNFNLLKSVHVVQGKYPKEMMGAWDAYSNAKTTYNYRPDVFNDQQIFVILELEYGGKDMTSFVLRNGVEAESVLKQIAISFAIAEESHLFEHRDLHLGNILVQRNKSKTISYIFRGKSISIPSDGLLVTIIDFTLSRILDGGCIYYNDLAEDESLFNQSGDVQFEVYKATKQQLKNQWHECLLYSNVLWLNFLCVKLQEYEYSRPSSIKHKKSLQNIKLFADKLNLCKSAFDCIELCKILPYIPEKMQEQECKLSRDTVFVDRKSFQKSTLFSKM